MLPQHGLLIAGVDEAGRGPLAGPVIAAAVILDPHQKIAGLANSKKLTPKKREYLYQHITNRCMAYAIGKAEPDEIDRLNILNATLLAMQRAVQHLSVKPTKVMVDGNRCPLLLCETEAVIQGDDKVPAISAASILAKVVRDRIMDDYDKKFPQYGFGENKGYATEKHRLAIYQYGITPMHRKSCLPVRQLELFAPNVEIIT